MSLNPMFRRDLNQKETNNLKKQGQAPDVPSLEPKPKRKTRSDKKYDVKIPLTLDQRRMIRLQAAKKEIYPTHLCTHLIKKGLERGIPFPEIPYPSSSDRSYPAKLESGFIDQLTEWTIEWDCSRKQAAHRILIGMLKAEGECYE
jgi:hypothetical protein